MTKTVKTKTTLTTVSSTVETPPVNYMPITPSQDTNAEQFYKDNGIKVRKMNKFGKYRTYAIIPVEGYEDASEEEKEELRNKTEAFNRGIDSHRRRQVRSTEKYLEHEVTILSLMMECGYDPAIDSDKPLQNAQRKINDADKDDTDLSKSTDLIGHEASVDIDNTEYDDCSGRKGAIRYSYDSSADNNNPEYIVAKNILFSKLYAMIDKLNGEDLEIVKMIMAGTSERQLARDLGMNPSTLQYHREKLMARFRESLKNDYVE